MNMKDTAEQISQYTSNMYRVSARFFDTYADLRSSEYIIDDSLLDRMGEIYAAITRVIHEMEDLCICMTKGEDKGDE